MSDQTLLFYKLNFASRLASTGINRIFLNHSTISAIDFVEVFRRQARAYLGWRIYAFLSRGSSPGHSLWLPYWCTFAQWTSRLWNFGIFAWFTFFCVLWTFGPMSDVILWASRLWDFKFWGFGLIFVCFPTLLPKNSTDMQYVTYCMWLYVIIYYIYRMIRW